MGLKGRGNGNWANAATRSKSRRASLIGETQIRQLLKQTPDQLVTSLADLGYREAIDIYSSRLRGADLVEVALNHDLQQQISEVFGYCQGRLKDFVQIYTDRFSYLNAEVVFRAVSAGSTAEEVANILMPDENAVNMSWLAIIRRSETLPEAIEAMSDAPWGETLAEFDQDVTLAELEDALERDYIVRAMKNLGSKTPQTRPLVNFLSAEVDSRNIVNLLRALKRGLPSEERLALLLPGGRLLKGNHLRSAAAADSPEALVDAVKRVTTLDISGLESAVEKMLSINSLDPVVRWGKGMILAELERMNYLYPLSALPTINYLGRKVQEVANLQLIVRGKAHGIDSEELESRLVM